MLAYISLFCGPGGLDEGFKQEGFTAVYAADIDPVAVETHRMNHPEAQAEVCDLSRVSGHALAVKVEARLGGHKLLGVVGGPPCQGFSVMNAGSSADDPRNRLPFHYARILKVLNKHFHLDFFVFENVPGLLHARHRPSFDLALHYFSRAGFNVSWQKLNALDYGVAQERIRVFVVGVNKDLRFKFQFPAGQGPRRTVRDAIGSLPPPNKEFHPNHWGLRPKSSKFSLIQPGDDRRKSFKRLAWDRPSPTVAYGHNEVHIHPEQNRRLTVLEAMLLQGFPLTYVLTGSISAQNRLVSEAVPPPVAASIAKALREQLGYDVNYKKGGQLIAALA
ncbi:MAG: DNA cytosine methyltransferase [Bacillota bacterium]